MYDAKLIGAVHWAPFTIVNDAVSLALFTLTLPMVIVPLFTSASNWLAEREQGVEVGVVVALGTTRNPTLAVLLPTTGSVVLALSETDTLFTMVVVAIMLGSTSAVYTNVAVELGVRSPMVHVPVEVA